MAQAHLVGFRLGAVFLPCRVLGLPFCQCPIVGKPRCSRRFGEVRGLLIAGVKADFVADDHGEQNAARCDSCLVIRAFAAILYR